MATSSAFGVASGTAEPSWIREEALWVAMLTQSKASQNKEEVQTGLQEKILYCEGGTRSLWAPSAELF